MRNDNLVKCFQGFDISDLTILFRDEDFDEDDDVTEALGISVIRAQTDEGK